MMKPHNAKRRGLDTSLILVLVIAPTNGDAHLHPREIVASDLSSFLGE